MQTIVEVHSDERGIIWPTEIAPYQVHLIDLNRCDDADALYHKLVGAGILHAGINLTLVRP